MHRLYSDENFPLPVVEELRRLGFDVLTMYEDGSANQSLSDTDVLAAAIAQQRAVVTTNRKHFIRLYRQRPAHNGIVVCTFDPDFMGQARRLAEAIESLSDLKGQLVRIYRPA